jgi:hypothetical protein
MPLETAVKRNGRTLTLNWDYNMLSIMYSTCVAEAEPDHPINDEQTFGEAVAEGKYMDWSLAPIYYMGDAFPKVPLLQEGRQELKKDHKFRQFIPAGPDGEPEEWRTVELKAGDVCMAGRVGR